MVKAVAVKHRGICVFKLLAKREEKIQRENEMATKSINALSMLRTAGVGQTALKTARKILDAILNKPKEPKYRRINLANKNFLKRLGRQPGGVNLLRSAGFVKNVEENVLEMPDNYTQHRSRIKMVMGKIDKKIEQLISNAARTDKIRKQYLTEHYVHLLR